MKNHISFGSLLIIIFCLVFFRLHYAKLDNPESFKSTEWDIYGYYLYLPGLFIYHDIDKLEWHEGIEAKYQMMGDRFYQVQELENGNRVGKYLIGTSIMQAPFFWVGHQIALHSSYEADGFSLPYQYALALGIVLYIILAFVLLRWLMLKYFADATVAITLLLLLLASNAIQYLSVESTQSHAPLFLHYVLILVFSHLWHSRPRIIWAVMIGLTIGLATISRPTEIIIVLIPLLWNTHTKKEAYKKWKSVRAHYTHLALALFATIVAALPQLIYWKHVTGHFVHNVPSAWDFLTPHFQVLFGFEKGWFIYTPITLFFIAGLFFLKKYPFKKSIICFVILNIYIIISWRDWHYGASYSSRALVQSYPVFAFSLAALMESITKRSWKIIFAVMFSYFTYVNLVQIYQYNHYILHYNKMNFENYRKIYLKINPSSSDTDFWKNEEVENRE